MKSLDVNYKLRDADPANATVENVSGSAYASHTGTPNKSGRWTVSINAGLPAEAALMAEVIEYESWNGSWKVPVAATGGTFTNIIPGMSITLANPTAAGNQFRVVFSRIVPEAA